MFSYVQLVLYYIFNLYSFLITIDIVLSWFPSLYELRFVRLIHNITNPYMKYFDNFLVIGPLDFTPVVGIIILEGITFFCFL